MIAPMEVPIAPKYAAPTARTPGRYEGLVHFAAALTWEFGPSLATWTVLDVGGADGWLGEMLRTRGYAWVDPRATGRGLVGLGEALPISDAAVDLVVSKQTLPHFTDPVQACREMCRVARHAVVIRQDWGYRDTAGGYLPIGWPGHSRSQIDRPADILDALSVPGWAAAYDDLDFIARRTL